MVNAKILGGGECSNTVSGTVFGFLSSTRVESWELGAISDPNPTNDSASVSFSVPTNAGPLGNGCGQGSSDGDGVGDGGGDDDEGCVPWCKQDASITKALLTEQSTGDEVVYSLKLASNGVSAIPIVVVRDQLPDTLELVAADAPPSVRCEFTDDDAAPGGGELTCETTGFQPGDVLEILVRTRLVDGGSGCSNTAVVETWTAADQTENPRNDPGGPVRFRDDNSTSDESVAPVLATSGPCASAADGAAVLKIDKQVDAVEVLVGEELTYRLVYRNVGDADATDVVVTDDVPDGLSIVEVSDGCTVEGQLVSCVDPVLPAGVERFFEVTVVPTFEGSFVNEARVTSREGDPEVDDDPTVGSSVADSVAVDVRGSSIPVPAAAVGDGLPSTGRSWHLVLLGVSLAAVGIGLVLLAGPAQSLRTAPAAGARPRTRRT